MATSNAARDSRQLAEARTALMALLDSGEKGVTGATLFGDLYRGTWRQAFLRRLAKSGLIRVTVAAREDSQIGRSENLFLGTPELRSLVRDKERLGEALWKGNATQNRFAPADASQEQEQEEEETPASEPRGPAPDEEVVDLDALNEDADRSLAAAESAPDREAIDLLAKVSVVVLRNIVDIRQRLTTMEERLGSLQKAWE